MAKLKIQRNSEWNNKTRNIGIYIDGKKVKTIEDGETLVLDLSPGKYTILAKIDWCRSQTLQIELTENEHRTIMLYGFKYGDIVLPVILGVMVIYYLLKYIFDLDLNFIKAIAVIGFLYHIYYFTLGKNRYLRLNEMK